VKLNPELSKSDQDKLWSLLQEYGDIFSDVPAPTNLVTYDIKLKSDEPISHKPYNNPVHLVDKVEKELEKMLKLCWIERSDSEYASPMVIVKKRDLPDIRICVSYKSLNEITEIDPTPNLILRIFWLNWVNLNITQLLMHVKGFMPLKWKKKPRNIQALLHLGIVTISMCVHLILSMRLVCMLS